MKKSRSIKKGYFSPREIAMLYERYPHAIDTAALAKEMKRTVSAIHAAAARRGIRKTEHAIALIAKQYTGKGGQFTKGFTPWNKGMKGYQAGGRSAQTRFVAGQKPHTTLPVGSYRITKDGYLEQKWREAPGNANQRWRSVHRLVWEAAHGAVPKGHIVIFKAGKSTNVLEEITLDRLELISRAENLRRNHPRSICPELGKLYAIKGAITRQVNRINREAKETQE